MATKNIVPNDNGEGGIGVTGKRWSTAFINTVTGNITGNLTGQVLTAAQTNINSILATDLIIGEDAQTAIDFGTVNEIDFKVDNANRLTLTSSVLAPATTNQIDLGTASLEFKNAFFDGTVTADAFAGPLTGNVTGNVSGTAATVTGAAQSNITSLGTLTGLTLSGNIILPQTGVVAFNSTSDEYIQGAADQLFFGTGNLARLTLDNSNATFTGNIKIPDAGTIGSATDADALKIEADGVVISTQGIEFEGTALGSGQSGISSSGNGGEIRIYTNGNQAFTFGASGAGGDLVVENGDIAFSTAGKGICLGVTSNTDANSLDDYEEGTFNVEFGGATFDYTNTTRTARYTKIGRLVTVNMYIVNLNWSSGSGNATIENLPFIGDGFSVGVLGYQTPGMFTTNTVNGGYVENNDDQVFFVDLNSATEADFASTGSDETFMFTVTYTTDT